MFDLGWGELLVVGVVALVVLGPKELPNALRTVSNLTKTARKLANEFHSGVNEIVREAELEEARKAAKSISRGSVSSAIEKVVDPTGEMKSTVAGIEADVKEVKAAPQVSPGATIPPSPVIGPNPTINPAVAAPEPAKDADATDSGVATIDAEAKA